MTRKERERSRKNRSSTRERRGKPPETLAESDEAVAIYTDHVEEQGRADLAVDLAMNLTNRSGALRDLGRHRDAVADLNKAVFIFTRLVEQEGREDLIGHLALTLSKRGGLLKDQDRLPEAVADFDRAIAGDRRANGTHIGAESGPTVAAPVSWRSNPPHQDTEAEDAHGGPLRANPARPSRWHEHPRHRPHLRA